ncbi:MAG: hypothetical protein ACLS5M_08610 [Ruminococcus sp.]
MVYAVSCCWIIKAWAQKKAPAVQVKNVEAQSVKTTAATEVYDFVKFKKVLCG